MFSMTTTELSTSIPTPSAKPDRLKIFNVIPEKYINTMANSTLSGILIATTSVGRRSFKKNASTITARIAPSIKLDSTLRTISLI